MLAGMPSHRHSGVSRIRAEEILKPWIPTLTDAFQHAWNWVEDILNGNPDRRRTLHLSTQAAMVYDRFISLILPLIKDHPNVKTKWTGRMLRLYIGNEIYLRFKKLDNKLRSGNVPTKNQDKIYYNLIDLGEPATSITFGYVVNPSGTGVRGLYLTCPKSYKQNEWMCPLLDASDGGMPLFAPQPLPPSLPLPIIKPIRKPGEEKAG